MEAIFTWEDFIKLALALLLLYVALKFATQIFVKLTKKTRTKRWLRRVFDRLFIFYIPVGITLLLIVFVGINILAHGIVILILGLLSFNYIKSYLNGIQFRSNPLVEKGKFLQIEDYSGEIEQLLAFGVILKGLKGKRFVNYSTIEKQGFGIKSTEEGSLRRTLYLNTKEVAINIPDLLFENPLINYNEPPELNKTDAGDRLKLVLTMEKGAKLEHIIEFLEQHKINATIHK